MDGAAGAFGQTQTVQLVSRVHHIQGVAAFVDDAEHGRERRFGIIVGSDAHVLIGDRSGKRMDGLAQRTVFGVQRHHFHQPAGQLFLDMDGIILLQEGNVRLRLVGDLTDQGHQFFPKGRKEAVQHLRIQPALVIIKHQVI